MPLPLGLAVTGDSRRHGSPWYFYTALAGYVAATYPLRALAIRRLCAEGRAPVLVVTYHRIADDGANAWTCSNAMFERHVAWLSDHLDIVSLAEAQRRIREGNRVPCLAITFDDGYAENCERALPLLARLSLPATYFVTFENVAEGKPFDHDVLMGNRFPVNTPAELKDMVRAGFEIGSHGRTHRDVASLAGGAELVTEIVSVRAELESLCGGDVRHYAFPYGERKNLSAAGFAAARQAGYLSACSDYGGYNLPGDDSFHVLRHSGTDDMVRLLNWATHDWRKAAIGREL